MDALGTDFTIACPAFPANRRTIYQGYLFVGDVLLNESGMRHHPLTPMADANLVRVLQQQVQRRVGLVDYGAVAAAVTEFASRNECRLVETFAAAITELLVRTFPLRNVKVAVKKLILPNTRFVRVRTGGAGNW